MITPAPQESSLAPRRPHVLRGGYKAIVYFIFVLVDGIENCLMVCIRDRVQGPCVILLIISCAPSYVTPGSGPLSLSISLGQVHLFLRKSFLTSLTLFLFSKNILSLARAVSQAISSLCRR